MNTRACIRALPTQAFMHSQWVSSRQPSSASGTACQGTSEPELTCAETLPMPSCSTAHPNVEGTFNICLARWHTLGNHGYKPLWHHQGDTTVWVSPVLLAVHEWGTPPTDAGEWCFSTVCFLLAHMRCTYVCASQRRVLRIYKRST